MDHSLGSVLSFICTLGLIIQIRSYIARADSPRANTSSSTVAIAKLQQNLSKAIAHALRDHAATSEETGKPISQSDIKLSPPFLYLSRALHLPRCYDHLRRFHLCLRSPSPSFDARTLPDGLPSRRMPLLPRRMPQWGRWLCQWASTSQTRPTPLLALQQCSETPCRHPTAGTCLR
jgi:hypothetical protein